MCGDCSDVDMYNSDKHFVIVSSRGILILVASMEIAMITGRMAPVMELIITWRAASARV